MLIFSKSVILVKIQLKLDRVKKLKFSVDIYAFKYAEVEDNFK